jgi:hypothetical protein
MTAVKRRYRRLAEPLERVVAIPDFCRPRTTETVRRSVGWINKTGNTVGERRPVFAGAGNHQNSEEQKPGR